jgi:hypothetical protein
MAEDPRTSQQNDAELGVGTPANLNSQHDAMADRPQEDWGDPAGEAVHGATHTRRPDKTEAVRGQGRRTLERNREIVKGKLYDR